MKNKEGEKIFKKKAAERLKALMRQHNVEQPELAKATTLSQATISHILNEVYRSYKSAFLLGMYFKVNPLWLAGMVDDGQNDLSAYEQKSKGELESEVVILSTHKESLDSYIKLLNQKIRTRDDEINRLGGTVSQLE
jgi:transcriptional regulator with XRE-family HTH domain